MKILTNLRKRHGWIFYLLLTLVITLAVFAFSYRIGRYDYQGYPMIYSHDGMEFLKQITHIAETGNNWSDTGRLAAPHTSNLYGDFPTADLIPLAIIYGLVGLLGNQPYEIVNIYIFLTFALTAVVTYMVFHAMGLKPWLSLLGSVLFNFLPYHFIRINVGHIYLASYFVVPLAVHLSIMLLKPKFALSQYLQQKHILIAGLYIILIGSVGTGYYAFFAVIIFLLSGVINYIRHHNRQALAAGILLSCLISIVFVINISPSLLYQSYNGRNSLVERNPAQIEEFGLRLSRLIVPIHMPHLPVLEPFLNNYYNNVQHENYQYMGIFSIIGFGYMFYILIAGKNKKPLDSLALLVFGILCIGLSGGIAYLISSIIGTQIRAYNRLSIFIACFALYGLLMAMQRVVAKSNKPSRMIIAIVLLASISLVDQVSYADPHARYWQIKQKFDSDKTFVQQIESAMPPKSMIYQLPHMSYPEASAECDVDSYDHFIGYLHSSTLLWSFGAVQGRSAAYWHDDIAQTPLSSISATLRQHGYTGIYLDKGGCLDFWEVYGLLTQDTGGPTVVSPNQRLFFFKI